MRSPYVTPQMLQDAPLPIAWNSIPSLKASELERLNEQTNVALRASDMVDAYVGQPIRATLDVEQVFGPDYRMTLESSGVAHVVLSRYPILKVTALRVASAQSFPRAWSTLNPATDCDLDESILPLSGSTVGGASASGASGIYIKGGVIPTGKRSTIVEVTYINGWPHATLTADAAAGATTLSVDDVTGFVGAFATVYDGGLTEGVTASASSGVSGPGTLTVPALVSPHQKGTLISCVPANVQQATMLFAAHVALIRGATALTVQGVPGTEEHPGAEKDYATEAEVLLSPYKRVI